MSEKLRVDVLARGETRWATNALEFDTPEEARLYALDLRSRWTLAEQMRVVPVSRPRGERYEPEDPGVLPVPVPLFDLGQLLVTPGAEEVIGRRRLDPRLLLVRHVTGDWGDIDQEDQARNDQAVQVDRRILSAYG